jgi:N-acetylglucosaminyldiphosphoundecaprenol N-acetyl-beta-D-mannosaminyltransferase
VCNEISGIVVFLEKTWARVAAITGLGVLAILVVWCAMAPTPDMKALAWIPMPLARWADSEPTFRNFPAFAGLALVAGLALRTILGRSSIRQMAGVAVLTSAFGAVLELLQLGLPQRHFDPDDIFWTIAGAVTGAATAWLLVKIPGGGTPIDSPDVQLLGIRIHAVRIAEAVAKAGHGGLILAPSGPGLCDLTWDTAYREALRHATLNLPDSGLAILLARIFGLGRLPRTSGLGFLEELLRELSKNPGRRSLWVMPSAEAAERNGRWLDSTGIPDSSRDHYIAPLYPRKGPVEDSDLLALIRVRQPAVLLICTGSGSQEKLGHWLSRRVDSRMGICCIGAAIGFLSGDQVRIPRWADRACLGWLLRCASEPKRFLPRYLKAFRLVWLVARHRDQAPPIRNND